MRRAAWLPVLCLILCGCASERPLTRTEQENQLFGPVTMKLDTFSKVKDWSGNGKPDGIEALVEFDDQFGDRSKAAGTIYFELYEYRPGWPNPKGTRLANPWSASLTTFDEQQAHWERVSGAYNFRLEFDGARLDRSYVLAATFESSAGARFFSQIILKAQEPEKNGGHVDKITPTAPR
jgi:hypothetical protein